MQYTNKHGLPDGLVRAVQNDPYHKGDCDFSATELLKPARQRTLMKRHAHEIVEDASDRIWALLGQATHSICERANNSELVEKRFFAKFEVGGKAHVVSAQIDSFELNQAILSDYKVTTQYKAKPGAAPDPDFTAQLNIQAEILRQNAYNVKELRIIAILRDWSKNKARQDEGLPDSNVVVLSIPMWSSEQAQSFIKMRIALHLAAETSLPQCSSEETWSKPDIYAVVKGKRAISGGVQYSLETAERICRENPGTRVEFRKGESMRCELYCAASAFCSQFQKENQQEINEVANAV